MLILGAVAYDPKVVTIWDGFKLYFEQHDLPFDYVLYSTYEAQVAAHLAGHIQVAWNSPLAWIQAFQEGRKRGKEARAIAMRDSDQDLSSVIVVRSDSPYRQLSDLAGKRVGVGAADSPQATMIPLEHFAQQGVMVEPVRHDRLLGKHGDHIGGEREAAKALMAGQVEAACMIDGNYLGFSRDGTFPAGAVRVLGQTALYDHCNFTIFEDAPAQAVSRFVSLLLQMSYDDPRVRPLLDMEGLKAWKVGRVEGYALLERAVARAAG